MTYLNQPLNQWRWQWVIIGALYGLSLRFGFGWIPKPFIGPMSVAFLVGTPFVVGALSVYGIRETKPSFLSMIGYPCASIGLMLLGSAISLMEGLICLAIMSPLFFFCAIIGGLFMGLLLRIRKPKPSELGVLAALPIFLLVGEQNNSNFSNSPQEIKQEIEVNAAPQRIWAEILDARDIREDELPLSVTHLIGVPKPVEGVNHVTSVGEVRDSRWQRGVTFQAKVTQRNEYSSITWHYVFGEHSFPPGTMDEHVQIGGRYFDLQDTTFNLYPIDEKRTRLEIVAHYRVTSSINMYAIPVTRILGNDFVHSILYLYKGRSERAHI